MYYSFRQSICRNLVSFFGSWHFPEVCMRAGIGRQASRIYNDKGTRKQRSSNKIFKQNSSACDMQCAWNMLWYLNIYLPILQKAASNLDSGSPWCISLVCEAQWSCIDLSTECPTEMHGSMQRAGIRCIADDVGMLFWINVLSVCIM